jgi:hypothetical protein
LNIPPSYNREISPAGVDFMKQLFGQPRQLDFFSNLSGKNLMPVIAQTCPSP